MALEEAGTDEHSWIGCYTAGSAEPSFGNPVMHLHQMYRAIILKKMLNMIVFFLPL